MKKGEHFQLSASWWEKNKAKPLKSAGGLGAVLQSYETAVAALQQEPAEGRYKATLKLAGEVGATAKALAAKCVDAVHAETKAALLTAPGVVAHDTAPLSKEAAEYQGKLSQVRKRYVPMAKKVDALKAEYDDIIKLAHNFDQAVKTGYKTLATKRFNEFTPKYRNFAPRADEPLRILKDEKELVDWCKDLADEDGKEVVSVLMNMQQFMTVWKRDSPALMHLAFEGKGLVAKLSDD